MDKYAIIVAGGSGSRMGTNIPKQFLTLHDKPVIWHSVKAFQQAFDEINIILVLPKSYMENSNELLQSIVSTGNVKLIAGGDTRFHSVKNGLSLVPKNCVVFVHDGVRCLLTPELIQRCYDATITNGNAVPSIPAVDTIRIATSDGSEMIDRTKVRIIQTPQTFMSDVLKNAYLQEYTASFTDDASVVETMGEKIFLIDGDVTNIKITRKIDLLIAEQILQDRHNA